MNKVGVLIISGFLMAGCATQDIQNGKEQTAEKQKVKNERIIYRDLTKPRPVVSFKVPPAPVRYKVPQKTDPKYVQPPEPETKPKELTEPSEIMLPKLFIEFANESAYDFDSVIVDSFLESISFESEIMLVGHSHGKSAVGTLNLAAERAETIQTYLQDKGYINTHVMAAWGGKTIDFAPSRGVHLYLISKKGQEIPLTLVGNIPENNNGIFESHLQASVEADCGGR